MAPKVKIEKQQLIDAAFDIAVNEGMDKITIRKVAGVLGSSIAPIYVNFADVESLKLSVQEKALDILRDIASQQNHSYTYLNKGMSTYLNRGVANLIFASKYPLLFNDIILKRNINIYGSESTDEYLEQMQKDSVMGMLSKEQIETIVYRLFIFHVGLTVLSANDLYPKSLSLDQAIHTLEEAGNDMLNGMIQRIERREE